MSEESSTTNGAAFDWDDAIDTSKTDVRENTVLPPGEYKFSVEKFERGFYNGSRNGSIKACPEAKITIRCTGEAGATTITERLKLWEPLAWIISSFFIACGLRKSGDKTPYPWDKCVGATGRCTLEVRDYTNKDGEARQINNVKRWLPPALAAAKFTPGQF